jgi:hypothetical protein
LSWWRDDSFDMSGRDVVDEPGDTQPAREGFASIVFVAVGWCAAGVSPPAGEWRYWPTRGEGPPDHRPLTTAGQYHKQTYSHYMRITNLQPDIISIIGRKWLRHILLQFWVP